ncbi:MAG: hypothetical protein Q4P08_06585 [Eubacteriales bacterium]|nr:hypothetical protein [Eubacteriales bacterium]
MNKRELKKAWDYLNPDQETSARIFKKIEASAEEKFTRGKKEFRAMNKSNRKSSLALKRGIVAAVVCLALMLLSLPLYQYLNKDRSENIDLAESKLIREDSREVKESSEALKIPEQEEDSTWQVDPQLRPYKFNFDEINLGEGMGFEVLVFKNREEFLALSESNINPTGDLRPSHLPIFRNLYYEDHISGKFKASKKEMIEILKTEIQAYNDLAVIAYFPEMDDLGPGYSFDEEGEVIGLADSQAEVEFCFIEGEKYNYLMAGKADEILILFKEPLNLFAETSSQSEKLVYNPYPEYESEEELTVEERNKDYQVKKEQVITAFNYIYEEYVEIFNYQKPEILYPIEDYLYNEQKGGFYLGKIYRPGVQERSGRDLSEEFINRTFERGQFISFIPFGAKGYYKEKGFLTAEPRPYDSDLEPENTVYGIRKRFYREGINMEKLADYPLRTEADAKAALLSGQYRSTMPIDFDLSEELIVRADLVYKLGYLSKDYLPYYKFYIEAPTELQQPGYKAYGPCYVPAIHPDYLEPADEKEVPLFNG